jgi:hypothetical protein
MLQPNVGDRAPIFARDSVTGERFTLERISRPVALVFLRHLL